MKKEYTIGEIFRLGLLKNKDGKPYTQKSSVSVALRGHPHEVRKSAWGPSKMYSSAVIKDVNARWNT